MSSTLSRQQVPFTYVRSARVPVEPEPVAPAPAAHLNATRRGILFCTIATLVIFGVDIAVSALTGDTDLLAAQAGLLAGLLAAYGGTVAMTYNTPITAGALAIVITLFWSILPLIVHGSVGPYDVLFSAALVGAVAQGIVSDLRTRRIIQLAGRS